MAGYGIPNMRAIGYCVCTNHGWGSAFRGYGSPEIMFPSEVLMDELALKGGWDPLELRYINCYRPGDTNPSGQVPDSFMYPEMIDILRPKYKEALANAKRHSTDNLKKGVGVAFGIYGAGLDGPDSAGADAELNPDGSVTIFNTWQDHGQGSDLSTMCFAHEALKPLGIPASKVKIFLNDTSKCPNSGPAAVPAPTSWSVTPSSTAAPSSSMPCASPTAPSAPTTKWSKTASRPVQRHLDCPGQGLRSRIRPGLPVCHLHVRPVHGRGHRRHDHRQDPG